LSVPLCSDTGCHVPTRQT